MSLADMSLTLIPLLLHFMPLDSFIHSYATHCSAQFSNRSFLQNLSYRILWAVVVVVVVLTLCCQMSKLHKHSWINPLVQMA